MGHLRHGRRSGRGETDRAAVRGGLDPDRRGERVTSVLVLVSGVVIAAGAHAGLYVLVVPVVAALAGGVASAWLLLTRIDA